MSCEHEEIQEDSGTMCQFTAEIGCVPLSPYVITLMIGKSVINWGLITSFLELHQDHEEVEGSLFVAVHGRRTRNNGVRLK